MSFPEVYVNYVGAGRIEINFDPIIKYWKFPKNNQDEIISSLYKDITFKFVYRLLNDRLKEEMIYFVISKLKEREALRDVIFPIEIIKLECEKW